MGVNERKPKGKRRRGHIVLAVVAVVVVLGVSLGVGLGVGLKHPKKSSNDNSSENVALETIPRATLVGPPERWLRSTQNFTSSPSPTTRYFNFTLTEAVSSPGALGKRMLVINGQSPGPTIEAGLGDRVVVRVQNNMGNATAMHWHGMFQRGTNWMDGTYSITQCGIPPGGSMEYDFVVENPGTTWYHAHRGMQYTDGLYGALIVHAPNETQYKYSDEVTLLLSDMYNTPAAALLWRYRATGTGIDGQPGDEPAPDGGMINGVSQARCAYIPASNTVIPERRRSLTKGTLYPETNVCGDGGTDFFNLTLVGNSTYRLRLINSGSLANTIFSIDRHNLTVIAVDGTPVDAYPTQSVNLAVAQRADVLLTLDQAPGAYWIRSVLGADQIVYTPPGFNDTTLGVLRYAGVGETTLPPDVPAVEELVEAGPDSPYVPSEREDAPQSTLTHRVQFNSQYTADNNMYMFFNSSSWEPLSPGQNALEIAMGNAGNTTALETRVLGEQLNLVAPDADGVMDLVVNNLAEGAHPFHLHGHKFWILYAGDHHFYGDTAPLNTTNPLRRDTLVIPGFGGAVIRFRTDNPGVWAFHCHIGWHMETGLLLTVTSVPDQIARFQVPEAIANLCRVKT